MNENDLNRQMAEINENVAKINRRIGGNGMSLWRGILSGFGYIVGAFIAVLIIGWVLNAIGVIPAFKQQVESLKDALRQAQTKQIPGSK
jgi:hypothetical protein